MIFMSAPVSPRVPSSVSPIVLVEDELPIHVEQVRQPPVLRIRASSGRFFEIEMTPAQRAEHAKLHRELLSMAFYGERVPPGACINVTAGTIEVNGETAFYGELDETVPMRWNEALTQLRQLYHGALGQRFSDVLWYSYIPGDRAHSNAPLPFQARKDPALVSLAVDFESLREVYPDLDDEKIDFIQERSQMASAICAEFSDYFEERLESLRASKSLDAQSRIRQIQRAQSEVERLDRFVMDYAAIFLSPFPQNELIENKKEFLNERKREALDYLSRKTEPSFKMRMQERFGVGSAEQRAAAIDAFATELALLSCGTAASYSFGCSHFGVEPSKTTTELSVIWLADRMVTSAMQAEDLQESSVANCLQTAFASSITSPQERELLVRKIADQILSDEAQSQAGSEDLGDVRDVPSLAVIPDEEDLDELP